jgi:hypothetical protein
MSDISDDNVESVESKETNSDDLENSDAEDSESESESSIPDYFSEEKSNSFNTKVREAGKYIQGLGTEEEKKKAFGKQPVEVRNALREKFGTESFGAKEDVQSNISKQEMKNLVKEVMVESQENNSAPEAFNDFLKKSGYTREEFHENWGKEFLDIVEEETKSGKTRLKSMEYAVGQLTMKHGFVPKKAVVEEEFRNSQRNAFGFPPAGESAKKKETKPVNNLFPKRVKPTEWYKPKK